MKTSQSVHFPLEPLTSISRPPTNDEFTTMAHYHHHASHCSRCKAVNRRHGGGEHLCKKGEKLALDVVHFVYGGGNGHAYSRAFAQVRFIRVEVPAGFTEVKALLRLWSRRRLTRERPRSSMAGLGRSKRENVDVRRSDTLVFRNRSTQSSRSRESGF